MAIFSCNPLKGDCSGDFVIIFKCCHNKFLRLIYKNFPQRMSMKINKENLVYIIVAIVCLVLFGVWHVGKNMSSSVPVSATVQPSQSAVTPEPKIRKAYITGEVNEPGVYEIPKDCRIEDLIRIAGGATTDAALDRVNLADHVVDAQQITIPGKNDPVSPSNTGTSTHNNWPLNINTATKEQLMEIPGFGDVISEAVITYREQNGDFTNKEDIKNVYRVGEKLYDQIKDYITVD